MVQEAFFQEAISVGLGNAGLQSRAEAHRFLDVQSKVVASQPGLHSENLSQNKAKQKQNKNEAKRPVSSPLFP